MPRDVIARGFREHQDWPGRAGAPGNDKNVVFDEVQNRLPVDIVNFVSDNSYSFSSIVAIIVGHDCQNGEVRSAWNSIRA